MDQAPYWVQSMNHPVDFLLTSLNVAKTLKSPQHTQMDACVSYVLPAPWSDIKDKVYVAESSEAFKRQNIYRREGDRSKAFLAKNYLSSPRVQAM